MGIVTSNSAKCMGVRERELKFALPVKWNASAALAKLQ